MDGSTPREMESSCSASVLLLPKLPDFHVSPFVLPGSQATDIFKSHWSTKEEMLELFKVPEGFLPKVVFTFNSDSMFENLALLERAALYHFGGKVVVAGGFTDMLVPEEVETEG